MRQQARSARKKNKEVFFSSPTTTPLRWVDFEEKIESVNRLYSVTTCEQKTKDCARSGSFQLQCLPAFMTSLPDCNSYVFYDCVYKESHSEYERGGDVRRLA